MRKLAAVLDRPLRCLYFNPLSVVWTNERPDYAAAPFRPLCLVSASVPVDAPPGAGWHYVQGAGDDEEGWSCGLRPRELWYVPLEGLLRVVTNGRREHLTHLTADPQLCAARVAEIVAQRVDAVAARVRAAESAAAAASDPEALHEDAQAGIWSPALLSERTAALAAALPGLVSLPHAGIAFGSLATVPAEAVIEHNGAAVVCGAELALPACPASHALHMPIPVRAKADHPR
jgi:hypothetical protein